MLGQFEKFLQRAKFHLPSWWTASDTTATLARARARGVDNIYDAIEKDGFNGKYKSSMAAMAMRMWIDRFAETKIGSQPPSEIFPLESSFFAGSVVFDFVCRFPNGAFATTSSLASSSVVLGGSVCTICSDSGFSTFSSLLLSVPFWFCSK